MDAPVWNNSMRNKRGRLPQGWKEHVLTDTIKFILHKDKPKDRRTTYVRAVCNIWPQNKDTRRTRLTTGGNLKDYPGEVRTPTSELTTMKLHVNIAISEKNKDTCAWTLNNFTWPTIWTEQNTSWIRLQRHHRNFWSNIISQKKHTMDKYLHG